MTPVEVLRAARKKIETPDKWCKFSHALTANGLRASPTSPKAVCFCVSGAIGAAAPDDPSVRADALNMLADVIGFRAIPAWNDAPRRTHAEVIAAFDRAIDAADVDVAAHRPHD